MEKSTQELINELQMADDFFEFAKENETELDAFTSVFFCSGKSFLLKIIL